MAIPQSQTEFMALQQFRTVTQDLNFNDGVLMRFLRARNLDLNKAEDMIRKFVIWRAEAEVNKFYNWCPPMELFNYDIYFTGFDHEGRPVFWSPFGQWPYVRDLLDKGLTTDLLKFSGKNMDRIYRLLLKTKHQQFVAVVDSEGITFSKVFHEAKKWKSFQILMQLLTDYEANFPELLNRAIMVNTPRAFMWGWKFLCPLLSDYTKSKVNFYGSNESETENWKSALFNYLPEEAIPDKYGGKAKLMLITDDNMELIISSLNYTHPRLEIPLIVIDSEIK